jgi:hypothetical protein
MLSPQSSIEAMGESENAPPKEFMRLQNGILVGDWGESISHGPLDDHVVYVTEHPGELVLVSNACRQQQVCGKSAAACHANF